MLRCLTRRTSPWPETPPRGRLYFTNHSAPCRVIRVFTVQVNCDYVAAAGLATEKFRVHIDPRRNVIIDVEASFNP